MKTIQFSNGDEMPVLGLGTWKSGEGEVYRAVQESVRSGYRHIDCAAIYGNEAEIGQAIADLIDSGEINRDDLWITSKLWNDSHKREHVFPALQKTLNDLRLEYLDLYLIHWPVAIRHGIGYPKTKEEFVSLEEVPLLETWEAMILLQRNGLARHIGVSNFNVPKIKHLIAESDHKPEMNQVEMHPYLTQNELVAFSRSSGIPLTAYSPLGSRDRPERIRGNRPELLDNETVKAIADQHNISPAQVLIAFILQRGVAVIPKSVHKARIKENLAAAQITLRDEDVKQLLDLNQNMRYIDGGTWTIPGSPNTLDSLWNQ